jgi:hypothetical protein
MLHVHGGSVLLEQLRAARIPGAFLEWCDVLCQGPLPAAVTAGEWRDVRARFLDEQHGRHGPGAHERLAAQDAALERGLTEHDEVVLWFSGEWFCQAILVCLLARLDAGSPAAAVSLVSIGEHPGVTERSCTLAFLSAEQLREQHRARLPVTSDQTALARRAWNALRAPAPTPIADLVRQPMPLLPFAREGLARHLRELPATGSGLSLTERHVLEALADGAVKAIALFPVVARRDGRQWITDTIFATVLRRLAADPAPLVTLDPPDGLRPPSTADALKRTTVTITATGRDVLAGRTDWIALGGIDRWVGGVHLTPANAWRWDEAAGMPVESGTGP